MNARKWVVPALLLAGCAHVQSAASIHAAAQVLDVPPKVGPIQPFAAPVPKMVKLANGLPLMILSRPSAPLETLVFTTRDGAIRDGSLPGLASLTGELMQAGSAGYSASQIAQQVSALGAELHLGASREDLTGILTVLPGQFPAAVKLMGEVILQPNLDPQELARVKKERIATLVANLDDPHFLAGRAFNQVLFGDSPYGTPLLGTQASIGNITLSDVKAFLAHVGAQNSAVVVAGPLPQSQVQSAMEKAFGHEAAGEAEPSIQSPARTPLPAAVIIDKPNAPQSVLNVGEPSVRIHNPSRWALELGNLVFGGSFTSRINQDLREKHGYTYGASSGFEMLRGAGSFIIATDVKTAVTAAAIERLQAELAGMASAGVSKAEMEKARALFTSDLVGELQTTPGAAQSIAALWVDRLPLDDFRKVIPAIQKIDAAQVNAAWNRAVDPKSMTIVIVGNAKSVRAQMKNAGLPQPVAFTPAH